MKIAVSATGKELSSAVDPQFGRAPYLLIIESDTGAIIEAIDNREANEAAQGAGIKAAGRIAEAGAKAILTGIVGPKAAAVCKKAGIDMINGIRGTVAEAIEKFPATGAVSRAQEGPGQRSVGKSVACATGKRRGQQGQGQGKKGCGCRARRGGA
jgi:predicted Fe-Mo cluster-binding NifX family protein